jgi:hypothetical protein
VLLSFTDSTVSKLVSTCGGHTWQRRNAMIRQSAKRMCTCKHRLERASFVQPKSPVIPGMKACKRRLVRECFEQPESPAMPGWYIIELLLNGQSIVYFSVPDYQQAVLLLFACLSDDKDKLSEPQSCVFSYNVYIVTDTHYPLGRCLNHDFNLPIHMT